MITRPRRYPLRFSPEDSIVRPLEDLAGQMRVSCGFLRLCQEAGCCREVGDQMSAAGVLLWLFDHYEKVRALAGLPELVPVEDVPPAVIPKLRMANALATLLAYSRTRATDWRQKRQLRRAAEQVERLADRLG